MVILRKVRASTLMETLVASVLIVVIFMISSMALNQIFSNSFKSNIRMVDANIIELIYLYKNDKVNIPYRDDHGQWEINIDILKNGEYNMILFEATNKETEQSISKTVYEN